MQDYQLVEKRIDIHALCLGSTSGCPPDAVSNHVGVLPATVASNASDEEPISATAWYFRGQFAASPKDKITAYTHTIEAKKEYYLPALINRCLAYRDLRDYQAAEADCTRAVEIAPGEPTAHNNLGWAYEGAGDHQKAIECYTRALGRDSSYRLALENRADSYAAIGDFAHALRDREETLRKFPNDASAYNDLAWLLIDHRLDLDRGIDLANKAVKLRPDDANPLDTLGWGYYLKGQYDKALKALSKARKLEPTNEEIKRHYAEIQKASTTINPR